MATSDVQAQWDRHLTPYFHVAQLYSAGAWALNDVAWSCCDP